MTFKKLCSSFIVTLRCSSIFISSFAGVYSANFLDWLEETLTIWWTANSELNIKDRFEDLAIGSGGPGQIRDFILEVTVKMVIPLFIFAGIVVAIVGFYKLMMSDKSEDIQTANNYILRWVVGVVIMVSAWYIANELVGAEGTTGIFGEIGSFSDDKPAGAVIAENLYLKIIYPFVRIVIFVAMGILFIIALINAFKYLFSADEAYQKKSFFTLIYSAVGIVVIILAKSIIEIVYGRYQDVINANVVAWWDGIGEIGNGILTDPNFSYIHTATNRVLGLATFVTLILIVYQAYQLLVNPNSEDNVAWLKKNIWYIFLGILVIGAAYLITSFFTIT